MPTCANDKITALPAKVLDSLSHHDLRLAGGIVLGRVEEVDAKIVGLLHASKRLLVLGVPSIGHPATQADGRDVQAGASEAAIDHARVSGFRPRHFVKI